MDPRVDETVMQLTVVLLFGGICLVAAGTAGLGGSVPLAVALLALAGVTWYFGSRIEDPRLERYDVWTVADDLWVGPAIAGAVVLLWLDASAGEVQSLGGILGLMAMLNYFLRPVYHLLYGLGARVANVWADSGPG